MYYTEKLVRFSFGKNWVNYLKKANSNSLKKASKSIEDLFNYTKLNNVNFLDVGCGSGIFSLAARKNNMSVTSFDFDKFSVQATQSLKNKYFKDDLNWKVMQGSILDLDFLKKFKYKFEYVYSWGVLHHTGNMMESFENISTLVKDKGFLIISIYNDQGILSRYWLVVKKLYNSNIIFRFLIILFHFPYFMILRPIKKIILDRQIIDSRGMIFWYDYLDWLGGYPFEVAKPKDVISFFKKRGFNIKKTLTTKGKLGCNEFIFQKINL